MLETVEEAAEDWRIDDIKGLLGRCNFKSNMLDRKVSVLSGGEKVCNLEILFPYSRFHSILCFSFFLSFTGTHFDCKGEMDSIIARLFQLFLSMY